MTSAMTKKLFWFAVFIVLAFLVTVLTFSVQPQPVMAKVLIPPQRANQVTASVDVKVTHDSKSGLYTYTYTVTSALTSVQEIWFFALEFSGKVVNATSPRGWSFLPHIDRPIVNWGATEIGPLPPGYVDDGNVLPSPFQIKPGQTLGGFSIQSPDPPASVRFYLQGFTTLPHVTGDEGDLSPAEMEILELDFTENSFTGTTKGPQALMRRPSVRDFLTFVNIANGDTRTAPVSIMIKLGRNGETVDRSTFHATLNQSDVTGAFVPGGKDGDLVAVFNLGSSPLKRGRNVLLTMVNGIEPGTTRTTFDMDRLMFFVK